MNPGILTSGHRPPPMPYGLLGRPTPVPMIEQFWHPEALDWQSRVRRNGGSVSIATLAAVSGFCNAIDAAWIRDRFLRLNLFAGSGLAAALVPLYRGQSLGGTQFGNTTDTNVNFVAGDYSETGSTGGLKGNGSTKYLRTGVQMRTPPYTFASNQITQGMHLSVSATSVDTTGGANFITMLGGNGQFGGTAFRIMSAPRAFAGGSSPENSQPFPTSNSNPDNESLIVGVRDPASPFLQRLYQDGSQVATQGSVSSFDSGANHEFAVLANWNNGSPNRYSNSRLRTYSIGYAMTAAQVAALTNATIALNTALAR